MISSPFELLILPAVPGGHEQDSISLSGGEEGLTIGVSQSSITTLALRPPQVLKTFSIPPGTLITDVNGYCYATQERNKFFIRSQMGKHVEVTAKVHKIFLCSDLTIAVDSNAHLHAYKDFKLVWSDVSRQSEEYMYSAIIEKATLVVVSCREGQLVVRTVSCESNSARELFTATIPAKALLFSSCEGNLYLASGKEVYLYKLPEAQFEKSIVLNHEISSFVAIQNNNLVVSQSNGYVRLIDCTYESEISSYPISAKVMGYHDGSILALLGSKILGLSVSPSNGGLFESLGRALNRSSDWDFAFTDIFNSFQGSGRDTRKISEQQIVNAQTEGQQVLASIALAISKRDGDGVARVIGYCKHPEISWAESQAPAQQDIVYEDSDRQLDRELVKNIVFWIFGVPKLHFRKFIPLGVAIYFLTHPLFPTSEPEIGGLLHSLQSQPLLYRQAIVTMPGIFPQELVAALLHPDADIFNDAAQRLVEEYGESQILRAFETGFSFVSSASKLALLVERLSLSSDGWPLVGPLISAVGLLAWDPQLLRRLHHRFSTAITSVEATVSADAALKEVLQGVNLDTDGIHGTKASERRKRHQKSAEPTMSEKLPLYSVETLSLP